MPTTITARDWQTLIFLGLIWGSSFLFAHIAVAEIPVITLVFLRVCLASLALCAVMAAQRVDVRPLLTHWRGFTLLGLLSCVVPWLLIFDSQRSLGPGMGGILNATVPIFTVPLAHVMTRDEKLTLTKTLAVLIGFFGVVVLMGPDAVLSWRAGSLAALEALLASLSYALGGIYGRRFKAHPAILVSAGGLMASSVLVLPLSLCVDKSLALPWPSLAAVVSTMLLALVSTAFAFVLFYRLLNRMGASQVSLVTFIIPISAILLGVAFKGETFTLMNGAGVAIIAVSLLILDGRLKAFINRWKIASNVFD